MGKMKEIFIDIINETRGVDQDVDLDYQYDQYLLKNNIIKRDNLRKSLEQDVSDKQINTVLTNFKLK
jgi:hypothetical protein